MFAYRVARKPQSTSSAHCSIVSVRFSIGDHLEILEGETFLFARGLAAGDVCWVQANVGLDNSGQAALLGVFPINTNPAQMTISHSICDPSRWPVSQTVIPIIAMKIRNNLGASLQLRPGAPPIVFRLDFSALL